MLHDLDIIFLPINGYRTGLFSCACIKIHTHTHTHAQAGEKVCGYILEAERKVDFIVVGPLNEERKKSSGMGNNCLKYLIMIMYTMVGVASDSYDS